MKKQDKKAKKKETISVRIDPDKILEAHRLDINISSITRDALDKEIFKAKPGKCPTCGRA